MKFNFLVRSSKITYNHSMKILSLAILAVVASCSFKSNPLGNQVEEGHKELYAKPEAPKVVDEQYIRIALAATNDVQGHYQSQSISFKDKHNNEDQIIKVGGVEYLSSYLKILKQKFQNVLLLDSGNIFSETNQDYPYTQTFYQELGYDATTLGLNDFNLKLDTKYYTSTDFFKEYAHKAKVPLILSNLYDLKTARVVEWPGTLPYVVKTINGIKIGIIGLIPNEVPEKTPIDNRIGLYVEKMLQSTLKQARLLKSLGTDAIVVITNQGMVCGKTLADKMKIPVSKVNFEPNKNDLCDLNSPFGQFITRLPPNLINVVVGGTNNKVANRINDIIVLSGFEKGLSFQMAELFFNKKSKSFELEKSIIHQPTLVCHEFFKETNDCYYEDMTVDHKVRVPATFLGEKVEGNPEVEQKFHAYISKKISQNSSQIEYENLNKHLKTDLVFTSFNDSTSKLTKITLSGKELFEILKQDLNNENSNRWIPSPFKKLDAPDTFSFVINDEEIEMTKSYKVLVSISDLQQHLYLKKYLSSGKVKSLNHFSWNDSQNLDNVSIRMSSSNTVR